MHFFNIEIFSGPGRTKQNAGKKHMCAGCNEKPVEYKFISGIMGANGDNDEYEHSIRCRNFICTVSRVLRTKDHLSEADVFDFFCKHQVFEKILIQHEMLQQTVLETQAEEWARGL